MSGAVYFHVILEPSPKHLGKRTGRRISQCGRGQSVRASNSRDRPNSRVTSRHFDHSEQPRRYASFRPLSHRVTQHIDHPPNLSRL